MDEPCGNQSHGKTKCQTQESSREALCRKRRCHCLRSNIRSERFGCKKIVCDGERVARRHITLVVPYRTKSIRSVLYNVAEQVMLDLLRVRICRRNIGSSYPIFFFDTNAAADRLPKRLLTSASFMLAMAIFVRPKMDTAIEQRNTVPCLR